MIGRVISVKMNKAVTVLVERVAAHPLYKKTFIRTKRYLVMADENIKEGDVVETIKIRPISKNIHWKIARVIGKDLEAITEEKLKAQAENIIAEVMPEVKIEEPSNVSYQTEKTEKVEKKEEKPSKRKGKSES